MKIASNGDASQPDLAPSTEPSNREEAADQGASVARLRLSKLSGLSQRACAKTVDAVVGAAMHVRTAQQRLPVRRYASNKAHWLAEDISRMGAARQRRKLDEAMTWFDPSTQGDYRRAIRPDAQAHLLQLLAAQISNMADPQHAFEQIHQAAERLVRIHSEPDMPVRSWDVCDFCLLQRALEEQAALLSDREQPTHAPNLEVFDTETILAEKIAQLPAADRQRAQKVSWVNWRTARRY